MSADVVSLWPKLVYHLDEPIADPAAITCYLISKLARDNGTKVLLSGQGADELFGGYPRYQAVELAMTLGPAGEIMRLAGEEGEKRKPTVMAALRETLLQFSRNDGLWGPSSTWLVSAVA